MAAREKQFHHDIGMVFCRRGIGERPGAAARHHAFDIRQSLIATVRAGVAPFCAPKRKLRCEDAMDVVMVCRV